VKHINGGAIVAIGFAVAISVLLTAFGAYLAVDQRRVADQFRVWKFKPTAAIREQMTRDDMSPEGRFLYLASEPRVEARRDFNQICSAVTVDTSVLGCYLQPGKQIFLYHETDKRLDGTEEVMGAHEMLRAAWDRMTPALHARLLDSLQHVLDTNTDPDLDLAKRMGTVRHNDPADYNAELYATVGAEIPSVGSVLEASYDQYFVKRSVVTKLNKHSIAYLVALRKKVQALAGTMNTLNTTIDGEVSTFNASVTTFESDIDAFNARARRPGGFATQGQFNVARAALVARGNALDATATQINAQVDTFNADLTKLKALDKTAAGLVKSLNVELEQVPDITSV
jgi:hypothetical protein